MTRRSVPVPVPVPVAVLGAAALLLAACGGDDASDSSPTTRPATATSLAEEPGAAPDGEFNEADVAFLQQMIPHHEQAVEMARMALADDRGASHEVADLATRIESAQGPEIEQMRTWLEAWGEPTEMGDGDLGGMDDPGSMGGQMSAEDMGALGEAHDAAFDEMWLEMMVEHHERAVDMSTEVQGSGTSPDVRELAGRIIEAQQAEIEEMRGLLGS